MTELPAPARQELKSGFDRIVAIHEQRKALADDIKDVYVELKGHGFDTKALKVVIQRHFKDPNELQELAAVVELYESVVGTEDATRAGVTRQAA